MKKAVIFFLATIVTVGVVLPLSSCKKEQKVENVTLDKTTLELTEGEKTSLKATIIPSDAVNQEMSWSSSDQTIASVSALGDVLALKAGETTITVTTVDGGFKASCKVTVVKKIIAVTSISLDKDVLHIKVGGNYTFAATVLPENATDRSVIWSCDNTDVAMINDNGKVVGVTAGEANITATSVQNPEVKAVCKIDVAAETVSATGVEINLNEATLEVGATLQLKPVLEPENATDQRIRWTTSAEDVATVSESGLVTGIKAGSAEITATTFDGGFSAKCKVTVADNPISLISIQGGSSDAIRVEMGSKLMVTAVVEPDNASNKSLDWTTDNNEIASLNVENHNLQTEVLFGPKKPGQVVVTAASRVTPSKSASQTYFVYCNPTELSISGTASISVGETLAISVSFKPEYVTEKGLEWTSSDSEVVTVDSEGNITALAMGTATIKAQSTAVKNLSAECVITVYAKNKVSVNGGAYVTYDTGKLSEVLDAVKGDITSLVWENGILDADDITALQTHKELLTLDMSNVVFRVDGKKYTYSSSTYTNTAVIAQNELPSHIFCAFDKLVSVKLPPLKTIGDAAFDKCKKLPALELPESYTIIESNAFNTCLSLKSINLDKIVRIDHQAFMFCSSLPARVECPSLQILASAGFNSCGGIRTLALGKFLRTIGGPISVRNNVMKLELAPDNPYLKYEKGLVMSKDGKTIYACLSADMEDPCNIPSSVENIMGGALSYTTISGFIFPEGFERLSAGSALSFNDYIIDITLPSTLKEMNALTWDYCGNLKTVTVKAVTPPTITSNYVSNGAILHCNKLEAIYVPAESVDAYKAADGWKVHKDLIKAIE